jgi:hypothetical protein
MNDDREDKLMVKARQLSTSISPQRDLWPGIAEAIDRPVNRSWMPMFAQAAAVVLLVAASSGITWYAVKDNQIVVAEYRPELMFEQASFGSRYTLGSGFQEARDMLMADMNADLDQLAPEEREDVEKSLAVMHGVIVEINAELVKDPENLYLQEMLLKTYRDELALMRKVGGVTKNVMLRNDI